MLSKEEKIILYVDDEQTNLDVFKLSFSKLYTIFTTTNIEKAWKILNSNTVVVLICDQRMPEIPGIDFIQQVNEKYPDMIAILLTAFSDKKVLLDAINKVGLYRYILKPWNAEEIIMTLNNACEKFELLLERKKLVTDLFEQNKQLQIEKVRAEESTRLKASFLSNISHEIRTPMNGIIGFTELLQQKDFDENTAESYSKLLNISIKKLLGILDDIITLSELQSDTYSDVVDTISFKSIQDEFADKSSDIMAQHQKEHIETSFIFPRANITINGSIKSISLMLLKLYDNAVKFTHSGSVRLSCKVLGDMLIIECIDTGIGIPQDKQKDIFDPFYQQQAPVGSINSGNGIGLSIVNMLIQKYKGIIHIESEPGKGTHITVKLPC